MRLVRSEAEFAALRPAWHELVSAVPGSTPFQSWEWNFSWWEQFGSPGRLHLLLLEEDGRLSGIAPLCIATRYEGAPMRHLAFISRKRADYLDFIVRPGAETRFFAALFACLREMKGIRMLELRDLAEDSANLPHLLRAASGSFRALSLERGEGCASLTLPGSWPEYLASLGKNSRRNVGRYRRGLAEKHSVSWRAARTREEVLASFDDFRDVYRARWRGEHGATLFDEPRSAAFERAMCERAAAAGWFRFYLLYLDGRAVAGYLGYEWQEKFFAGLLAHLPEYHRLSAGSVLIGMSIEDCIARGLREFDMTRGEESYKTQWNCTPKCNYVIKISDSSWVLAYAAQVRQWRARLTESRRLKALRAWLRGRNVAPDSVTPRVHGDADERRTEAARVSGASDKSQHEQSGDALQQDGETHTRERDDHRRPQ
jgi:CelD/BcsL family acetyltransferase involved in cellulose biosynthesis